jgi:hypothetical protein
MRRDPATVPNLINSHVLYLNRCANGCKVTQGNTDSRTDHSDISQVGVGTLSAYSYGDNSWNQVVACVKSVMSPFNIAVTDQDPGSADHFEVMIGGSPGQLGFPDTVGGVADFPCTGVGQCAQYVPNALVFDFAEVWNGDVTFICGTAAQEIAHAWQLDHAVPSDDPMTYNNYTTPLHYRDGAPCGSDCLGCGGTCAGIFSVPCVGTLYAGTHVCTQNNQQTQDEVQTILKLFGPAGAKAPDLEITDPKNGSGEQAGFGIDVTCDSPDGVQEVDLSIDGTMLASLTAPPFHFTAPTTLANGIHHVVALCGTNMLATASKQADVIIGPKCAADANCTTSGDICYESVCIAGPMAQGGLGATCTNASMCASSSCASDGHDMQCVIPCDPSNDQCPAGFGCISTGATGVCWLGANKGGGCCDSGRSQSGALFTGLGFAALLMNRRRRR